MVTDTEETVKPETSPQLDEEARPQWDPLPTRSPMLTVIDLLAEFGRWCQAAREVADRGEERP